jgi:hypothetical protein
LPSILESYLLAVANAPTPPLFSSLRPYHLLRNLYDENPEKPTVPRPHTQLAAERNLGRWLLTGHGADGQVSGTLGLDGTESPEDRAKVATEWLERIGALARDEYMTVREGGRGHGAFSAITQRRQAARTPIFRDIAADVFEVTSNLRNLIAHALTQPQYMEDPTRYPDDDGFTAPSAGVTF